MMCSIKQEKLENLHSHRFEVVRLHYDALNVDSHVIESFMTVELKDHSLTIDEYDKKGSVLQHHRLVGKQDKTIDYFNNSPSNCLLNSWCSLQYSTRFFNGHFKCGQDTYELKLTLNHSGNTYWQWYITGPQKRQLVQIIIYDKGYLFNQLINNLNPTRSKHTTTKSLSVN